MSSTGVDIQAQLRRLGRARRAARAKDEEIGDEIRAAVEEARIAGLSMTLVARLLDIDRTQLYRTYTRE